MYASFKTEGRKPSIHAGALKLTQVSCLKNRGNQYLTEIGFMTTALIGVSPGAKGQQKDFFATVEPPLLKN